MSASKVGKEQSVKPQIYRGKKKKTSLRWYLFCHFFPIAFCFLSLSLSVCVEMTAGWLECWLWMPGCKRSLWESSWPSTPLQSPVSFNWQRHRAEARSVVSFIICSIARGVHYICKGTQVPQTGSSGEPPEPSEGWKSARLTSSRSMERPE